MNRLHHTLAAAILVLALCGTAAADQVVNFDDLTGSAGAIPVGYCGFNWNNFSSIDAVTYATNPSGYLSGMVSPSRVAYNAYADPASLTLRSGGVFHFTGAYLTAAWNTGLNIDITGLQGGAGLYSRTVRVDCLAATWFQFDWNVDALQFSSYGGTDYPGYPGSGEHFVMDNFTFTPEPATLSLLALGGLAVLRRRRKAARCGASA
jgi:hypothetical protein